MAKKSNFACWTEYAALRAACAAVNAMPFAAVCAIARMAAVFAFDILRLKRKRTIGRVMSVFPGIARAQAASIARESLSNVFLDAVEMIRAPRFTKKWIDSHVKDVDIYAERLRELLNEGRGVVIMIPHCGNWYMAAWAMASRGIPISAIAARQRNPLIHEWMGRQYGKHIDVMIRGESSAMHDVMSRLRAGRAFAILPDLRLPKPDVKVPFLNGTANISHGGAMFSVMSGAQLAVVAMRREKGKHVFEHMATLRPDTSAADKRAEAHRLTKEAMSYIDDFVKRHPGQWFWYNKRWILQPVNG